MNTPNPTMLQALRDQAAEIYRAWANGNRESARAMLVTVPSSRIAYVVITMSILALNEGRKSQLVRFIEEATQ